jgi:hypothetical protein
MERRARILSTIKLCDYHKMMSVALSSFVKCYEDGGFMWHGKSTGEDVLLKPYVHCFVGDIAGINEMIGHYNNNSANCLVADCKCNQEEILQFKPKCSPIKWADLQACDTAEQIFEMYAAKGLVSERDMSDMMNDPMSWLSQFPSIQL